MPNPGYDFVIRQGDTKPALTYTLTDATGAALNLTGATVNFVMRTLTSSTPAINASATVTNASAGTVSFSFSGTQTATAGFASPGASLCWRVKRWRTGRSRCWPGR